MVDSIWPLKNNQIVPFLIFSAQIKSFKIEELK